MDDVSEDGSESGNTFAQPNVVRTSSHSRRDREAHSEVSVSRGSRTPDSSHSSRTSKTSGRSSSRPNFGNSRNKPNKLALLVKEGKSNILYPKTIQRIYKAIGGISIAKLHEQLLSNKLFSPSLAEIASDAKELAFGGKTEGETEGETKEKKELSFAAAAAAPAALPPPPPALSVLDAPPVSFVRGNCTSVLHDLVAADASSRVAVFVAGNAGRPGGNVGGVVESVAEDPNTGAVATSYTACVRRGQVHPGHRTQEEDLVSNWLMTTDAGGTRWDALMRKHVGWPRWGMRTPTTTANAALTDPRWKQTMQGVDFAQPTTAESYRHAWGVADALLARNIYDEGTSSFGVAAQPATLIFVAAPNASPPRPSQYRDTAWRSMARTFDAGAHASYTR